MATLLPSHTSIMPVFRLLFLCLFLACLSLGAAEITEGMTRAQFQALAGKPIAELTRNNRTILRYPNKGKAEFVDGRLVFFAHIQVLDTPENSEAAGGAESSPADAAGAAPDRASADASGADAALPSSAGGAGSAGQTGAVGTGAPAQEPAYTDWDSMTVEQREMAQYGRKLTDQERADIAKKQAEQAAMQERFLNGEPLIDPKDQVPPPNPWALLLLKAVISIPVTVVVLKISFKWCDVDSEWKQMWLPAAADTLVRSGVQVLAESLWGVTTLFYLDDCLAFFALLFVLLKTTHACTAVRAVGVAFMAKVASVVVWSVLSVAILGLLFSYSH